MHDYYIIRCQGPSLPQICYHGRCFDLTAIDLSKWEEMKCIILVVHSTRVKWKKIPSCCKKKNSNQNHLSTSTVFALTPVLTCNSSMWQIRHGGENETKRYFALAHNTNVILFLSLDSFYLNSWQFKCCVIFTRDFLSIGLYMPTKTITLCEKGGGGTFSLAWT